MIPQQGLYQKLKPHFPFLYLGLLAVILFSCNGVSLWDQDEAAYAGFARHMLESGNRVVPEFMWSDVHRKPPLHFWNIALSYKVFGVNEFAVRFPSALFTLLTYLLVLFAGSKIVEKRVAFFTVIVLSTSWFVPVLAKVSVTDSTLLFFTTVCAFAVYFILTKRAWLWVLIFWAAFALAVLTKGPPVIIFSLIFITLLAILHPARKNLILLHPWFFLPLALVPFAGWAWCTVQYDGGEFLRWMLDWYVLKRVDGSVFGQTGMPGTHLLLIIIFFLPWLFFLPKSFKAICMAIWQDKKEALFFSAWFFSAWLIYEFSPSKLPSYVVAAHIPLAFFIAGTINKAVEQRKKLIKGFIIAAVFIQFALWLVFIPAIEPYRNTSIKVSNVITAKAEKQSIVLIGNAKYTPPSLPFYIGYTFKNSAEQRDLSQLMAAYYKNAPCVLVLSQKQAAHFYQLVPGITFDTVRSPAIAKQLMTDYYIAVKKEYNESGGDAGLITSSFPEKPHSVEEYIENIHTSPAWFNGIKATAIKENRNLDSLVQSHAAWASERTVERYNCQLQMIQLKRWREDILARAKQNGKGFEEQCNADAAYILSNQFSR